MVVVVWSPEDAPWPSFGGRMVGFEFGSLFPKIAISENWLLWRFFSPNSGHLPAAALAGDGRRRVPFLLAGGQPRWPAPSPAAAPSLGCCCRRQQQPVALLLGFLETLALARAWHVQVDPNPLFCNYFN